MTHLKLGGNGITSAFNWTQVGDNSLTTEVKTAWATYHKLLRDLPAQTGFLSTVDYPTQP